MNTDRTVHVSLTPREARLAAVALHSEATREGAPKADLLRTARELTDAIPVEAEEAGA